MKDRGRSAVYAAVLAGAFFGSIPVLSALLRDLGLSSLEQSFLRMVFSALFACLLLAGIARRYPSVIRKSLSITFQSIYIFQGILISLMVVSYLSSVALKTPVGEAALLVQVQPFATLILASVLLHEKITGRSILALICAFLGLLMLTRPWQWDSFMASIAGDSLALLNGLFYSIYLLVGRWAERFRKGIPSEVTLIWVLIWGFLASIPFVMVFSGLPLPDSLTRFQPGNYRDVTIVSYGLLLALFGSMIPYGLISYAGKHMESSKSALLVLSEPVTAMVLGWAFLNEHITVWYVFGGSVLAFSLLLTGLNAETTAVEGEKIT